MSMEWFIENKSMDKHSVAATKTYGTSRMDAYSIFEDTLNLKTVTVRDRIDDGDGKYHYEVNKNETMLASSALSARYFRIAGFALSSVPFVVITATMPPGLTWSSAFARK